MDQENFPPDDAKGDISRKRPHWSEWRDWANVAVSIAALLVSVVSIWFTVQISGIEDYFRSEITRRNSELDDASSQAQRLAERVERSAARLEDLRAIADRYSAASTEAQLSLMNSREQRLKSDAMLKGAAERLTGLETEIADREQELDEFRRDEVYQHAIVQLSLLRNEAALASEHLGDFALREMSNFGISNSNPEAAPLYEAVRTIGPRLCRHLGSFNPSFPADMEVPSLGPPPGRPTNRGTYSMTQSQYEEWRAARASWEENFNAVWTYNSSIRDARATANEYVRDSVWHCACVALKFKSESCQTLPERPNIESIIAKRPQL